MERTGRLKDIRFCFCTLASNKRDKDFTVHWFELR